MTTGARGGTGWVAVGGSLAAIGIVGWILLGGTTAPALGDFAEWTYHGVLLRDLLRGQADAGYVLKGYPVPNSLTTVMLGGLMTVLPWVIAAKVFLIGEVLLGLGCAVALRRAAGEDGRWPVLVLTASALLGTNFWAGFSNFTIGTALAMLMGAMLLRDVRSRWWYAVLLLAVFFSHMIPFGFALVLVGGSAWQRRRWALGWQALPALAMTAWYFAGRAMQGNADGQARIPASVAYLSGRFWIFKANTYVRCWGFVNPAMGEHDSVLLDRVGPWIFGVLFVLNAVVAAVVLVLLLRSVVRSWRTRAQDRFFWLGVAGFVGVACMMPGALAGISDPGGRMMQVAVWSGVAAITVRGDRGGWRWLGPVAAGSSAALLGVNLYLLATAAMRPPVAGSVAGPFPAAVRQFAHVYYADRTFDYGAIERGRMEQEIYPTALFLKRR